MDGTLEDRLAALERAVTDGECDCSALAEGAAAADRVAEIEDEIADLSDRVAELEAATQALRGYVGNVRSVNTDVEQRADLALSKAEAARRAVDRGQSAPVEADESATRRCDHCDQPLDGERSDGPETAGTDGSRPDDTGPAAGRSRLDALGERGRERRVGSPSEIAGAQTDGGRSGDRPDDSDGGVFARVRTLL